MALEAGTKLGPYEILSPLGAGGMGEVYLANDSKLDRKVAIKVLPESMVRDNERVARFEREAKLLASLNHPNIAAIHGFDDSDGTRFLVMEYVEGETLGDHLKNGPVAVEDALDIGKQIAEALEAAHGQGVIHRDLKPANVMVRQDGTVKVLDFGLAKAMTDEPSGHADANSPTITANYTRPGVVLGTAAYMSPEQARGRKLDKRTDIWSFGIILFECLTGETLFRGETATDSMGAIMHKDPEWSLLPPTTPPTIQLLLRRCLTKDRKRRLHDIADARIELENALVDPSSTSLGIASVALAQEGATSGFRSLLPWATAVVAILVAVVGIWQPWREDAPQPEPMHLSISAQEGYEFDKYDVSPDGLAIAYCRGLIGEDTGDGNLPLQLRKLNEPHADTIRGTEGGHQPVFSPSGRWIAYEKNKILFRVRRDGSPPVEIARLEREAMWMGCWLNENHLLILHHDKTLSRLNVNDGSISKIDSEPAEAAWMFFARPTPLSDMILTNTIDFSTRTIARHLQLRSFDPKRRKDVISDVQMGGLTPSNHLLFARDGSLLGSRFDPEQLETTGEVTSLLAGVRNFIFTSNGTLVHGGSVGPKDETMDIVLVSDVETAPTVVNTKRRDYKFPSFAPNGQRIASAVFRFDGGTPRIWVLDLDTGIEQPLTRADLPAFAPVWSPDGLRIAYMVGEPPSIQVAPIDGSTEPETLIEVDSATESMRIGAWVGGHSALLLNRRETGTQKGDILLLSLDDGTLRPILDSDARESVVALSPNEQILAFSSDVSGETQTYLQRIDFKKGLIGVRRRIVTSKPLVRRHWSADGAALLGIDNDGQIWSVAISVEPELSVASAEKILNVSSVEGLRYRNWQPSPDGKGHMFLRGEDEGDFTKLHVVLNFQTLLDRRLPNDQQ